ncbi:LysR substrate-binding domain-containing protein, partial [Pseudomonas sp. SAICEU22]
LALYYCSTPPKNMKVTALFNEEIFPVCSPAYLSQHPEAGNLEQLGACTWLWLEDQHRDWIGWKEWFQRLGHPAPEPRRRININNYSMLIQSALAGQGIALAWTRLLGDHLQTGNLVRPTSAILSTDAQFCLLEPLGQVPNRQSVNRFREWLMARLAQTEDA